MSRRYSAVVLLLLVATIPAFALSIGKFRIRDVAAGRGRVAFIANGLVVLDAKSGAVIVRERSIPSATLFETPHGVLVAIPQAYYGSPSRFRLFSTRGDPAWEVTCDFWHAGQDDLICVDSQSPKQNLRVQVRSLTDGQIRWSFDTGGSGGEALDAKGRLIVANRNKVDDDPRNTRLTIFDLADGRVLGAIELPKLKPFYGGASQPDFEFDGERVLMRLRDVPGCPDAALQTYEFDPARGLFLSSTECEPTRQLLSPPPEPVWTEAERAFGFRMEPLKDNSLVSSGLPNATLFERRSPGAERWQVIQPYYNVFENSWQFGKAHEQADLLFLEHNAWHFGTLDCIDLATGRPLWRYVFPSVSVQHWIGVLTPPSRIGRFYESDWQALQNNAPPQLIGLIRPLTLDEQRLAEVDTLPHHDTAPTTFDPAAVEPWPTTVAIGLVAVGVTWLPIGAGIGLFVVSRRERVAPRRSLRRVFIGLALVVYLLIVFIYLAVIEMFAAASTALLLAFGAYCHVMVTALSVETSRLTWLVRGSLALFLLCIGFISLQLF